jgi:DNA transposition AAA+ family ATPase
MTLSQVLSGKYEGDWRQFAIDLDRWLDDAIKREAAPRVATFVRTQVALEIETVADMVVDNRSIGLLIGDSGIGKSLALRAVAETKPGSIYVTLDTAHNTPTGVLELIVGQLGLTTTYYKSEKYLFDLVRPVLANTSRLLIVDEAHAVLEAWGHKAFHTLRYLHDATNAPQLWCSTVDLIAKFRKGEAEGRQPLEQIRRRISIRHNLMERASGADGGGQGEPLFTVDEVRAVFGGCKMRLAPDAARYLMLLANLPKSGGLGAAVVLMNLTYRAHHLKADVITAAMLKDMIRFTEFRAEYQLLQARLEQHGGPRAAKVG